MYPLFVLRSSLSSPSPLLSSPLLLLLLLLLLSFSFSFSFSSLILNQFLVVTNKCAHNVS